MYVCGKCDREWTIREVERSRGACPVNGCGGLIYDAAVGVIVKPAYRHRSLPTGKEVETRPTEAYMEEAKGRWKLPRRVG